MWLFHAVKRGAHRHFGLPKPTPHQPVHIASGLAHIAQYGVNRLCPDRGRRFNGSCRRITDTAHDHAKASKTLLPPVAHKYPTVPLRHRALFPPFLPGARPCVAAQFMQRRALFRAAGIAANQMQLWQNRMPAWRHWRR